MTLEPIPEGGPDTDVPAPRLRVARRAFISLLADGYLVRAKARGMCMAPLILRGDLLTVRPAAFAQVGVGDIVAYRRSPRQSVLTTHRVLRKITHAGKTFLVSMGDQNRFLDGPLDSPEMVLGVVVRVERDGRAVDLETARARLSAYLRARLMLGSWYLRRPRELPGRLWGRLLRAWRGDGA